MFRAINNLKKSIRSQIKRRNLVKRYDLKKPFGCEYQEFKAYLESLFQPGMTWANYGQGFNSWNLDHIVPLDTATSVEELYKLSHFTNICPMWCNYNLLKGNMPPEHWELYKLVENIDESVQPSAPLAANAAKSIA